MGWVEAVVAHVPFWEGVDEMTLEHFWPEPGMPRCGWLETIFRSLL